MNVDIWVIRTLNQLFMSDSYTKIKLTKKNKIPFIVIGPFCTSQLVCVEMLHF